MEKKTMKHLALTAGIVAASALLLLATGCGSGGGTSPISNSTIVASNGPLSTTTRYVGTSLAFTTTIPKRFFARGEVVPITFTVTNEGTGDATFGFYTTGFYPIGTQPDVVLLPVSGNVIINKGKTTENVRALSVTAPISTGVVYSTPRTITLPAGQSQTISLSWNQISSNDSSAGAAFTQVAPGTYYIAPYLNVNSLNGDNMASGTLASTPLPIEIQ